MFNQLNKIKSYLYITIIFFLFTMLYTFLVFKSVLTLSSSTNKVISLIIGSLLFFFYAFTHTIRKDSKGIIRGFIIGITLSIVIIILNLIFKSSFSVSDIYKYAIYIVSSIIGGIIGINKHNKKDN